MDARTKSLIERAKQVSGQSYMARFRAQSIAGLALSLRRAAAAIRAQDQVLKK